MGLARLPVKAACMIFCAGPYLCSLFMAMSKETRMKSASFALPRPDCPLCPRLETFRNANRLGYPDFFNSPVPSFGALDARLLVVGLAPGLKGANRTGRPFTGDYAGLILYSSLLKNGFAEGEYHERADDGLMLKECRITNAVRCVPPQNKPEPSEIKTCNDFLKQEIAAMPRLKVILSLGSISHNAVLHVFGLKLSAHKFGHGTEYALPSLRGAEGDAAIHGSPRGSVARDDGIVLLSSYHCSRYNINTGTLTQAMFDRVVARASALL